MGFINFRGGQKEDRFDELSSEAKRIETSERERLGNKRSRVMAADYFGVPDMADKENSTVLAILLDKITELEDIHNSLKKENDLAAIFDDSQFFSDFWMVSISEILDQGNIDDKQKIKCIQLLMTAFRIVNQTSAKQFYLFKTKNPEYKSYLQRCFKTADNDIPRIWLWMEHLGNQPLPGVGRHDRNRMETTVHFIQKYMQFILGLSFYISQLFPGHGCGRNTKEMLSNTIDSINQGMTGNAFVELNVSEMTNPLYSNEAVTDIDYKGFEQSKNQAEGLRGVFSSIKKGFGKQNRVLQIIRLLDDCSESETRLLENEYKRMTRII